jgi:hypothetical protein
VSTIVTKEYLDLRRVALDERLERLEDRFTLRLEACEERLMRGLDELDYSIDRRLRAQTWIMTGMLVAGIGAAFAIGQAL